MAVRVRGVRGAGQRQFRSHRSGRGANTRRRTGSRTRCCRRLTRRWGTRSEICFGRAFVRCVGAVFGSLGRLRGFWLIFASSGGVFSSFYQNKSVLVLLARFRTLLHILAVSSALRRVCRPLVHWDEFLWKKRLLTVSGRGFRARAQNARWTPRTHARPRITTSSAGELIRARKSCVIHRLNASRPRRHSEQIWRKYVVKDIRNVSGRANCVVTVEEFTGLPLVEH